MPALARLAVTACFTDKARESFAGNASFIWPGSRMSSVCRGEVNGESSVLLEVNQL